MLAHVPQQLRSYNWLEQRPALHRDAYGIEDIFSRCSFEQVTVSSSFQSGDDTFIVIESGKDDDTRAHAISLTRIQTHVLAQTMNSFDAIHDRHFEIQQEDIGVQFQGQTQSFISISSLLWSTNHFEVGLSFQHSAEPLTHDRAKDVEPAWSPGGDYVVFRSDRDGVSNLYAFRLADRALLRVTNVLGGAFTPDVSPGGDRLAFAEYGALSLIHI